MIRAGAGRAILDFPDSLFPIENFHYLHDDLSCRVIILEHQETAIFVSLDLTSLQDYAVEAIKEQITKMYPLPLEQIFISVSHTFSAPHTRSIETLEKSSIQMKEKNQVVLRTILAAVESAMKKALETIQSVRVMSHTTEVNSNINRDVEQKNGYWIGKNPDGFSNKKVPILKFVTESQEVLAIIYSMDVQSSVVEGVDRQAVSSDFIGLINKKIEGYFNCPVLFLLGAAADQVPRLLEEDFIGLEKQTTAIADVLIQELIKEGAELRGFFQFDTITMTVKGQELPDRKKLKPTRNYSYPSSDDQEVLLFLLTFEEAAIVMMKPEITSSIGELIRANSPYRLTIIATMINGGQKYMADEKSYRHFTYEAMNSMFACGSAERVSKKIIEKLAEKEVSK